MTSNPSRRSVTAALVALPAAVAIGSTAGADDAELFALEREFERARATMREAGAAHDAAETRYSDLRPAPPESPPYPEGFREAYRRMTIGELADLSQEGSPVHPVIAWQRENGAAEEQARSAWQAECERISAECGVEATEREWHARLDEADQIAYSILAVRARTFPGIMVKLRLRDDHFSYPEGIEAVMDSVAADIRGMAGGGNAA